MTFKRKLRVYLILRNPQNSPNSRKHVHAKISTLKVYARAKKQGAEKEVFLLVEQNVGGDNLLFILYDIFAVICNKRKYNAQKKDTSPSNIS